jgi:hypothetical protein
MRRLSWAEASRASLRTSAWVVGSLLLVGVVVGAGWSRFAPRADWVRQGAGGYLRGTNPEAFVAADDWFFLAGLVVGGIAGAIVCRLVRRDGPLVAIALALGSLGGSFLAAVVGHWLTLPEFSAAALTTADGKALDYFLTVRAKSVIFGWPLAAELGLVLYALVRWPREPAPQPEYSPADGIWDGNFVPPRTELSDELTHAPARDDDAPATG